MTKFDHTSILRGLDSEDVASLRRLMNAIMRRFAGVTPATAAQMSDLDINEHAIMIWVTGAARHNPLLERMVLRFASARYGTSNTVLQAARELDLVVTEAVLNPDTRPARELVIAEGFFNQLVANGRAAYGVGADNEYGDIEPDSDVDRNDPNVTRKRTRSSNAATANKRPRMGVSWSDDEAFDDDEYSSDAVKEEEEDYDDDDIENVKGMTFRGKNPANKKHEAKRKHGERCIPDENTDRNNVVAGRHDLSKLHIEFKTERPDPANPGQFIPSDPVEFNYTKEVDWEDKASVSKLNSWRLQVFKRTLGSKRESRPPWTVAEQNKLVELVSSHLKAPKTGGRYSRIDWSEIERNFNSFFSGKTHKEGEMTAETRYSTKGRDRVAKPRKLGQTRPHIPRSAGAIENQLTHFTHPRAQSLVAAARKADDGSDDSGDEEPTRKGKGKAPARKGKSWGKKAVVDEEEEDDEDEDEEGEIEELLSMSRREKRRRERERESGGQSSKGR